MEYSTGTGTVTCMCASTNGPPDLATQRAEGKHMSGHLTANREPAYHLNLKSNKDQLHSALALKWCIRLLMLVVLSWVPTYHLPYSMIGCKLTVELE